MRQAPAPSPDAATLRSRIARHNLRRYELAAEARLSPTLLFELLSGRRPLDQPRAARIAAAIERLAARTVPS